MNPTLSTSEPSDPDMHAVRARSFDRGAEVYEIARPTYPHAAVSWLLRDRPTRVADLAAGTGKLTRLIAPRVRDVVAVDIAPNMLAQLRRAAPGIRTQVGSAERTGLPDAGADLVTVAQAWHWFDPAAATAEIARILRPGGALAIVYNHLDRAQPWAAAFQDLLGGGHDGEPSVGADLMPAGVFEVTWSQPESLSLLLEMTRSHSTYLTADDAARRRLLTRIVALHEYGSLGGTERFELPYRTVVHRFIRA